MQVWTVIRVVLCRCVLNVDGSVTEYMYEHMCYSLWMPVLLTVLQADLLLFVDLYGTIYTRRMHVTVPAHMWTCMLLSVDLWTPVLLFVNVFVTVCMHV